VDPKFTQAELTMRGPLQGPFEVVHSQEGSWIPQPKQIDANENHDPVGGSRLGPRPSRSWVGRLEKVIYDRWFFKLGKAINTEIVSL
jgi:hypothetical protein